MDDDRSHRLNAKIVPIYYIAVFDGVLNKIYNIINIISYRFFCLGMLSSCSLYLYDVYA